MADILAIAAHPDDAELACAGTLLAHKAAGYSIAIVDLTRGELGTRGTPEQRDIEAANSAKILELDERWNLGLKDGFFTQDDASLMKLIEAIRYFKPTIVLANSISDRHPDHARGSDFASRACFLAGLRKIETQYMGENQAAHRPKAVYHYIQDRYIVPDLVVDITPYFEKKMQSVMAYESQFFNPNNTEPLTPISSKEFLEFLEGRAADYGRIIGTKYGEGFKVERAPGIPDLMALK